MAGRVEKSFAHSRPFWWYLPLLPVMLFPWIFWPRLWRGGITLPRRDQWQLRFALVWWLPAFVAFSFISGKQPHYLLPMFPAFALMAASRMANGAGHRRFDTWLPAIVTLLTGLALALVPVSFSLWPELWQDVRTPFWLKDISVFAGAGLIALAIVMLRWKGDSVSAVTWKMALVAPLFVALVHMFVFRAAVPAYDLKAVSQKIAVWQEEGRAVAWRKKYHSQFHFLGRLRQPVLVVKNRPLNDWFAAHPEGVMVMTHKGPPPADLKPLFSQPFRGSWLAVWDSRSYPVDHDYFR